jgi:hypothetical protein
MRRHGNRQCYCSGFNEETQLVPDLTCANRVLSSSNYTGRQGVKGNVEVNWLTQYGTRDLFPRAPIKYEILGQRS